MLFYQVLLFILIPITPRKMDPTQMKQTFNEIISLTCVNDSAYESTVIKSLERISSDFMTKNYYKSNDEESISIINQEYVSVEVCEDNSFYGDFNYDYSQMEITTHDVIFNFFIFAAFFGVYIFLEFLFKEMGLKVIRSGKNIGDYRFLRTFLGRLGPTGLSETRVQMLQDTSALSVGEKFGHWLRNIFTRHDGKDGNRLLHFIQCLGSIYLTMILLVLAATQFGINLLYLLCITLIGFISTIAILFYYLSSNKLVGEINQKRRNTTLLVRNINCSESELKKMFEGSTINFIKKLDRLYALDERRTTVKETLRLQGETNKKTYRSELSQLDSEIIDELNKIDTQASHSAFVCFDTYESAANAMKKFHSPWYKFGGLSIEWASSSNEIQWSVVHEYGKKYWLKLIFFYGLRAFISLFFPSLVILALKQFVDISTVDNLVPYLKPILTMISFFVALILDIVHPRSYATHNALFISTITILVISDIIMPATGFYDAWDFVQWLFGTDPNFILKRFSQCVFRKSLGSRMAITIMQQTFLQFARLPELFHSFRIKIMAKTRTEGNILYKNRKVTHEVGMVEGELVTQFVATVIGYFSYPQIVIVSILCMVVRWAIERKNLSTFPITSTGNSVHRLAVICAVSVFPLNCLLAFDKAVWGYLQANNEDSMFFEIVIGSAFLCIFILISIGRLAFHFLSCPNESEKCESRSYVSPFMSAMKKMVKHHHQHLTRKKKT